MRFRFTAIILLVIACGTLGLAKRLQLRTGIANLKGKSQKQGKSSTDDSTSIAGIVIPTELDTLAYRSASAWGDAPSRRLYLVAYGAENEASTVEEGTDPTAQTKGFAITSGTQAPSRADLVASLARHNACIVSFIPDTTFLVSALPADIDAVEEETGAETAEYTTEHRVAPEWAPVLDAAADAHRSRALIAADSADAATADLTESLAIHRSAARARLLRNVRVFDPRVLPNGLVHEEGRRRRLVAGKAPPPMYEVRVQVMPSVSAAALQAAEADWPEAIAAAVAKAGANGAGACLPLVVAPEAQVAADSGANGTCTDSLWLQVYLCETDLAAGVVWLAAQPVVRWVSPRLTLNHRNAAASIVVETGDLTLAQYNDPVGPLSDQPFRRPYRSAGLDGTGEVVGVGDTGIDLDNCYFADPRIDGASYKKLMTGNPLRYRPADHRKLAQYWLVRGALLGDNPTVEDSEGHGTHTSGSIGGAILSSSNATGPYNTDIATGAAPRAKISMVDLSIPPTSRTPSYMDPPLPVETQYLPLHTAVGAAVISDSWGAVENVYEEMAQGYDRFLWNNPDVISFIAAGNNGSDVPIPGGTVGSPATAKSPVAVGMSVRVPAAANRGYDMLAVRAYTAGSSTPSWRLLVTPNENYYKPYLLDVMPSNREAAIVRSQPADACGPITNSASLRGAVVLAMGGGSCSYSTKALALYKAGAGAIIFINTARSQPGNAPSVPNSVRVPISIITQDLGNWLVGNITAGLTLRLAVVQVPVSIDTISEYSSYGPLLDGRIKPEIITPGVDIISAGASGGITGGVCSRATRNLTGTSMATPTAAGHAALVRQYFRTGYYPAGNPADASAAPFTPSGMLLKAAIIAGAKPMVGGIALQLGTTLGSGPDGFQGFGRMDLAGSLPLPGFTDPRVRLQVADRGQLTATGQSMTLSGISATGTGPVTVVLTWYDYPADLNAAVQLVNDLDLSVQVGGSTVLGNNAEGAAPQAADRRNTVERVVLSSPPAGAPLTLTVSAARLGSAGLSALPQRFAVAVVGHITGTLETSLNPYWLRAKRT